MKIKKCTKDNLKKHNKYNSGETYFQPNAKVEQSKSKIRVVSPHAFKGV